MPPFFLIATTAARSALCAAGLARLGEKPARMMNAMTRLALIGYGAMGRLVEQLAPAHGFVVALR